MPLRTPVALLAALLLTQAAEARPGRAPARNEAAVMDPLVARADACFAEAVLANPAARRSAGKGRWYEAAGITGFICRQEVDAMMAAQDAIRGPGAGMRFFRKSYAKALGSMLETRLAGQLVQATYADAEAGLADKDPAPAGAGE